jgi:hypothetical protein
MERPEAWTGLPGSASAPSSVVSVNDHCLLWGVQDYYPRASEVQRVPVQRSMPALPESSRGVDTQAAYMGLLR